MGYCISIDYSKDFNLIKNDIKYNFNWYDLKKQNNQKIRQVLRYLFDNDEINIYLTNQYIYEMSPYLTQKDINKYLTEDNIDIFFKYSENLELLINIPEYINIYNKDELEFQNHLYYVCYKGSYKLFKIFVDKYYNYFKLDHLDNINTCNKMKYYVDKNINKYIKFKGCYPSGSDNKVGKMLNTNIHILEYLFIQDIDKYMDIINMIINHEGFKPNSQMINRLYITGLDISILHKLAEKIDKKELLDDLSKKIFIYDTYRK